MSRAKYRDHLEYCINVGNILTQIHYLCCIVRLCTLILLIAFLYGEILVKLILNLLFCSKIELFGLYLEWKKTMMCQYCLINISFYLFIRYTCTLFNVLISNFIIVYYLRYSKHFSLETQMFIKEILNQKICCTFQFVVVNPVLYQWAFLVFDATIISIVFWIWVLLWTNTRSIWKYTYVLMMLLIFLTLHKLSCLYFETLVILLWLRWSWIFFASNFDYSRYLN